MAPKTLPREALRTVWDDLGYFRPAEVPLLFPRFDPASWPMRAAIYTRVSTADQNPELQLHEIQDYVSRQAERFVATYQDTISVAKASRPGLNGLMADAKARKFTCLMVWRLDRFGRSLVDCLNNIKTLEDYGIRFIAVTQGLDTNIQTPRAAVLALRPGSRGRIRAVPDPGADPGGPHALSAGLQRREGGEDGLQPIQEESGHRTPQADLQPGEGYRTPAQRSQHSGHCKDARRRRWDRCPDAAGTCQNIVASIWNRGARQSQPPA